MTLQLHLAGLILLAAFTHAAWNAMLKASGDRLLTFATLRSVGTVAGLIAIFFVPFPEPAAWPALLLSGLIFHNVYFFFLLWAYRHGDLNQVYPLARGGAPVLVAILAAFIAGEIPSVGATAGILLVSLGILGLSFGDGLPRGDALKPVALGLLTALAIAGYTVTDGIGTRAIGSVLSYIAWLNVLEGLPFIAFACIARRHAVIPHLQKNWRPGVIGGFLALLTYGLVLYALSQGAMAHVAALRETSVLFAALIGTFLLGEKFGPRRVLAAAIIVAGILILQFSR